jgi:hypothetical protein
MITLGVNIISLDSFSEGTIFSVMSLPPKKSWKNISNLSGGEIVRLREEKAALLIQNTTLLAPGSSLNSHCRRF